MSLSYDEILSDNLFGQIIIPAPDRSKEPSPSMTNNLKKNSNEQEIKSLTDEFNFPIDDLFNMARHFLKGRFH